jgi:hypothetical protein
MEFACLPGCNMLMGIYEYCGIQRCGKTTLMIRDLIEKILTRNFEPTDIYANFRIFIDGVNCLSTEALIEAIFKMKRDKERHKVLLFDEIGQFLAAREHMNKEQTKLVNFAWQMPKRDIILCYASNVGNSADVILRNATWITVVPRYFFGQTREEDYIKASVIFNYDCRVMRGIIIPGVAKYQAKFDSFEPIE